MQEDDERAAFAAALEVCACLNFRRAARAVTRHYDSALEPTGLRSTQFVMLVSIRAHEDAPLPQLAREIGLERSVLTRRLTPLERDGLVRKTSSETGGATTVRLTAKGRRQLAKALPMWKLAQERFVSQMGAERWHKMIGDLADAAAAAVDA